MANEITAKYEAMENRSRKIERASSSALGITLEKYHPTGTDKFLKYNSFMDTFTETVLKKDIKDFVKLEILKKSLGGEAYEAIQPYTNGAQLNEAIKILQDRYAKPRFVITEIYKNLKDMPKITSFTTSMKVAKDQVRLLKISVATLKSLGYEKELISETTFQNTFILVELERKIPLEGYNKWVDRKASLNAKGKEPNLQDFVNCYEQQVISISDAQYMRETMESISKPKEEMKKRRQEVEDTRNLLVTQVKTKHKGQQRKTESKVSSNDQDHIKDHSALPQKGRFTKCFCYFCNSIGHSPIYCKIWKLNLDQKKDLAIQNNACLSCLKIDGHKAKDCTFEIKNCAICNLTHNMNLHSQADKVKYFRQKKAEDPNNNVPNPTPEHA